jgi:hypothetical protein
MLAISAPFQLTLAHWTVIEGGLYSLVGFTAFNFSDNDNEVHRSRYVPPPVTTSTGIRSIAFLSADRSEGLEIRL